MRRTCLDFPLWVFFLFIGLLLPSQFHPRSFSLFLQGNHRKKHWWNMKTRWYWRHREGKLLDGTGSKPRRFCNDLGENLSVIVIRKLKRNIEDNLRRKPFKELPSQLLRFLHNSFSVPYELFQPYLHFSFSSFFISHELTRKFISTCKQKLYAGAQNNRFEFRLTEFLTDLSNWKSPLYYFLRLCSCLMIMIIRESSRLGHWECKMVHDQDVRYRVLGQSNISEASLAKPHRMLWRLIRFERHFPALKGDQDIRPNPKGKNNCLS